MKIRLIPWMTALLGSVALASCQPQQVVIPSNFTVKAAPGAPGLSRETAEEFLKRAPFPDSVKTPLHEGLCYAEPFYHDAALDPAGKDTDTVNGVDTATLFFNATLGTTETWLATPHSRDPVMCPQSASETHVVDPKSMRLGNGRGTGDGLRYFWQCASNVFAHGPRQCPAAAPDFSCPEDFDGTQDTVLMRNVYERRGGMLAPGIRMACGFSTVAFCQPDDVRRVWDLYDRSTNGYAVADAFIEGFREGREGTVPLCMTLGSASAERIPLLDETFSASPSPYGATHYHVQYPARFSSASVPGRPAETGAPFWAPIFGLKPMPLPATLKGRAFEKQDAMLFSGDQEGATGLAVRVHPVSGALYLSGKRDFDTDVLILKEDEYLVRASRFLQEWGLAETTAKPEGVRMMLESAPVINNTYHVIRRQKNVVILYRRHVEVDGKTVPVLGDGGLIRLQMNNDGSVARAAKIWREITGVRKIARVKPYDTAYKEAQQQLANPAMYKLDSWLWGYKELEGTADQKDLKIVYLFSFIPKSSDSGLEVSPVQIEIAAQLDMTESTIDR
ncbi:MAG TPA: hypothetical protein VFG28_14205 [Syntrophales bacterium]|nr:hypothetical protein [Syntrophales bacterium]